MYHPQIEMPQEKIGLLIFTTNTKISSFYEKLGMLQCFLLLLPTYGLFKFVYFLFFRQVTPNHLYISMYVKVGNEKFSFLILEKMFKMFNFLP